MQLKKIITLATSAILALTLSISSLAVPAYTPTEYGVQITINGDEIIENNLRYGRISATKYGEVLVGATFDGEFYQPTYELRPRAGATFEVRAAETITNIHSEVVYEQGQLVDTITTDSEGLAVTVPLHLGTFVVKEVTAPFGFVLNPVEQEVTLDIMDSIVDTYFTDSTNLTNTRQMARISLKKRIEMPKSKPDGFAPQNDISFILYARENIIDDDGNIAIPAGGAIEKITVWGGKTEISDDCEEWFFPVLTYVPFGSYYVKESSTNSAYVLNELEYDFTFGNDQPVRGDESFWSAVASWVAALFGGNN